jgi:predicted DNA-binding mobile mystery protein A
MVTRSAARRAREALDARLGRLGPADRYRPPHTGWVRAIRDALGMSAADLGRRMNVSGPAVSALERSERDGTVRLDTLGRAAAAMECTLVYAFIPNKNLEETLQGRARQVARRQLHPVMNTMALEDQAVEVNDGLVERQAELLIRNGRVWADQP